MEKLNTTFTSCKKCHAVNKVVTGKLVNSAGVCGKCGEALPFHAFVSEADERGLDSLIAKSSLPVVVDFWAPWCGPCKAFAPTFEAGSRYAEGKMVFIKVNTEQFPGVSQKHHIRGIPTMVIFKNGSEVARESGAFPLNTLTEWISRFF
jgi:thioredoxin 2